VISGPSNIALRYLQRHVLLLSLIPLGLLFTLTATLAREYHVREARLVREWFRKGNEDFAAGQARKALEDFRNALSYDPENRLVQMRLAEALLADGQFSEARTYFMTLWDRSPGSGEVNLDLARVSMQAGDSAGAVRYFQAAIYGSWEKNPAAQRRNVRLELCDFLLAHGRMSDAQAQLMALAADITPEDALLHEKTGQMFLRAGEPRKGLEEFEAALRSDSKQTRLMENAGEAAFAAGDYSKAEKYLARADRENPSDAVAEMLATARDVISGDPFQAALSDEVQASRSWRAFQRGIERLQQCAGPIATAASVGQPPSDIQSLIPDSLVMKNRIHMVSLIKHPELRKEAMQFVFRIEETTAKSCGTPAGRDQALILIGKSHEVNNP
jgi:tetratricopeptide (TPR) repeat protein